MIRLTPIPWRIIALTSTNTTDSIYSCHLHTAHISSQQQQQQQHAQPKQLPAFQPNYQFPIKIVMNLPDSMETDHTIFIKDHAYPLYKCKIIVKLSDIIKSNVLDTTHVSLATTIIKQLVADRYSLKDNTITFVCRKYINNQLNQRECFQMLDGVLEQAKILTKQFADELQHTKNKV